MNQTKKIIGIVALTVFLTGSVYIATKEPKTENPNLAANSNTAVSETPVSNTNLTNTVESPKTVATAPKPAAAVKPATTTTTATNTTTTPTASASSGYTAAQVSSHNSSSSCWTIVNGLVYDLTSWISRHPGGQGAIKGMCGVDSSDEFNDQHGGEGKPERILASYKIGSLK